MPQRISTTDHNLQPTIMLQYEVQRHDIPVPSFMLTTEIAQHTKQSATSTHSKICCCVTCVSSDTKTKHCPLRACQLHAKEKCAPTSVACKNKLKPKLTMQCSEGASDKKKLQQASTACTAVPLRSDMCSAGPTGRQRRPQGRAHELYKHELPATKACT